MFERFTRDAREVVIAAQSVARDSRSRAIDSRHLLLALVGAGGAAPDALRQIGVEPTELATALRTELRASGLDGDALASVGIDLTAVRERADAVFGDGALDRGRRTPVTGHLPFTADAKKSLELALREAVRLRTHRIDGAALFLGLLRAAGSPAEVSVRQALSAAGVDAAALRAALEETAARAS